MAPYLAKLIRAAGERGVGEAELLDGTGLTLARLEEPEAALPLMTGVDLLRRLRAAGLSVEDSLAAAEQVDLRSHGFLGYAVLASGTLGDALELALRYLRTRTRLLTMHYHTEDERAVIRFDEGVPLGELYPLVMDVLMMALFHIGEQMFGDVGAGAIEVHLAYSERPHHESLRARTGMRMLFDCAWCEVTLPAAWLARPTGTADPHMVKLAAEQCERALRDLEESEGLLGRVRQLAAAHLDEPRSVEKVAGALHMTPRTLRRRLRALGTSYQAVLEQLRARQAMDMLAHSRRSVDAIAAALGYQDPSNFGRAFRRWTGVSPTVWRRSRGSG